MTGLRRLLIFSDMLRTLRFVTSLVLLALLASACGQKGPLYLPRPDEKPEQER